MPMYASHVLCTRSYVVPANCSLLTIDARMSPGISEMTLGPSKSKARTPMTSPSPMRIWLGVSSS
jgi:hypothetical protein